MHIKITKFNLIYLGFLLLVVSCTHEILQENIDLRLKEIMAEFSDTGQVDYFILPESGDYQSLPNQDPNNPVTEEKVKLGKLLFFETGLAQDALDDRCYETFSCATCHEPSRGFLPGTTQGIADGAFGYGNAGSYRPLISSYLETELDAQGARPLTVMNVTYMTNTLWSGRFGANDQNVGTEAAWIGDAEVNHTGLVGLEAQNIEGLELHRMDINEKVLNEYGYAPLFDEAFPDFPLSERYSKTTASFALSAYLRTLLTNEAPFQEYLKGNYEAISESEKKGALLFFGKANCISCHSGPSLSSMNFVSLGTKDLHEVGGLNTSADDERNLGRASFTNNIEDEHKFKVPQLYNLKDYVSFFHGSSKRSIEDVVDFKIQAKSEHPDVQDSQVPLIPLDLTATERQDLINFLTDALHDEDMQRYAPDSILSGLCFPNNDQTSRLQIGCD